MKPDSVKKVALTPIALIHRAMRRGFSRNEKGAVAVEFGLLALPFFAIIGAILETSFFFLASQVLDSAVDTSARYIRTGQARAADFTADDFRTMICDRLYGMFDCANLRIDVETLSNFSAASFTSPLDPLTNDWTDTQVYTNGATSGVMSVRVYYKWPTLLDIMGFNLSDAGDGYRLMSSVRVFMNEP